MTWDQIYHGLWIAAGLCVGGSVGFVMFMSVAAWNRRRLRRRQGVE
jgi:hypothetical protein